MFKDDIDLVREMAEKYGPIKGPIVECGGLIQPTIADYQKTIDTMGPIVTRAREGKYLGAAEQAQAIMGAQVARYQSIERPLSFLGDYIIENPETGGVAIEDLFRSYPRKIGTAVMLSVLEHVSDPFRAIERLQSAMQSDGLVIVSVPWIFPHHPGSGEDNWRFSPTGLRHVFDGWQILECDWRLRIEADAGVLNIHAPHRPQAIHSAYVCARAW